MALLAVLMLFPACGGKIKQPNILLITIDTLRRDHHPFVQTKFPPGLRSLRRYMGGRPGS